MQQAALCGIRIFTPWGMLSTQEKQGIPKWFPVLMIGEWIYDQLPTAVDRIDALPLICRMVSGACMACHETEKTDYKTLGLGAMSAAGAAYASFHVRKYLAEQQKIPETFLGSLEDAVASFLTIYSSK